MNIALKITYFVTDLVLPLCIGYFLSQRKKGSSQFFDKMIQWNIRLFFPLMGLLSIWIAELKIELIWLPIFGITMQIIPGIVASFRAKKKYELPIEQGSYLISAMLSNRGVVGSLSVFILFGELGYAYARLVMMFETLIVFMFCYPLAQYFYQKQNGENQNNLSLKAIIFNKNQFPVLGVLCGLLLNFSGVSRPNLFGDIFQAIVHISAWFSLVPVGYSINFGEMKKFKNDMWGLGVIKFILTPLFIFIFARMVFSDPIVLKTTVILAFAPTAINAVVVAKVNKLNIHLAMASFIILTSVYLVLVYPMILIFINT